MVVTLSTFWNNDNGETPALAVLGRYVEYTANALSRIERPNRSAQQEGLRQWLSFDQDQLPDVFQGNTGSDILQFVDDDNEELCPLEEFASENEIRERYMASTLNSLGCNDTLYGVPMGVHRVNVLYANEQVYGRAQEAALELGVALPELDEILSVEHFVTLTETVQALELAGETGEPLIPLALDGSEGWPLQLLAHDAIFASYSSDAYRGTWMARPEEQSDEELESTFRQALSHVRRLGAASNVADGQSWTDAVDAVGEGTALFTVMGDWGATRLANTPQERDVVLLPFPGADGNFVYTVDAFAVPRKMNSEGAAARTFLEDVVLNRETLLEFSAAKHSLPPLASLTNEEFNGLPSQDQRDAYLEFQRCNAGGNGCTLLPAVSGLAPASGLNPCFERTGALLAWIAGSSTAAATLRDSECPVLPPASIEEAEEQYVAELLEVSKTQFAAECRD